MLRQVVLPRRGFQGHNQALVTLLSKKADAAGLKDYRPISFAKLVSKTLVLRLAPRLENLVRENQCAFIRKRCIHDNFTMVQQTARYLHRLMVKLDVLYAFDAVSWALLKCYGRLGLDRASASGSLS
jgi:hypothetical protein